jgi:hypothetical protein
MENESYNTTGTGRWEIRVTARGEKNTKYRHRMIWKERESAKPNGNEENKRQYAHMTSQSQDETVKEAPPVIAPSRVEAPVLPW